MPPNPLPPAEKGRVYGLISGVVVAIGALGVVSYLLGGVEGVILMISVMSIVLPITYFTVMLRSKKTLPEEKPRVLAYIPLFIAAAMFWLIFEQSASVIAEFADSHVDNHVFGWEFPVAWFQSVIDEGVASGELKPRIEPHRFMSLVGAITVFHFAAMPWLTREEGGNPWSRAELEKHKREILLVARTMLGVDGRAPRRRDDR